MRKIFMVCSFLLVLMFSSICMADGVPIPFNSVSDTAKNKIDFFLPKVNIHVEPILEYVPQRLQEPIDYIKESYGTNRHGGWRALDVVGIKLNVQNKTNKTIVINLNNSVISAGRFSGRPIVASTPYSQQATANIPPMVIPAGKMVSKELFRSDWEYRPVYEDDYEWTLAPDYTHDKNLFGDGSIALDDSGEYITIEPYAMIDRDKMGKYR